MLVDTLVVDRPGRPQQAILDELRRVILDGAVPPGTPIPVGEVAELFGVSAIPVRESLKTLTGEGLVAAPSRTPDTPSPSSPPANCAEMYIVRETLESAALSAAVANATDVDRAAVADRAPTSGKGVAGRRPADLPPPESALPPRR